VKIWSKATSTLSEVPKKVEKMKQAQKRKAVSVDGVLYEGVREAARAVGESRQLVVYRLKSPSFPNWYYL
jgi:hypothetical protein